MRQRVSERDRSEWGDGRKGLGWDGLFLLVVILLAAFWELWWRGHDTEGRMEGEDMWNRGDVAWVGEA